MDTATAWKYCVTEIEKETSTEEFTQWIRPLKAQFDGSKVVIYAHNEVVEEQVRGKYLTHIRHHLKQNSNGLNINSIRLMTGNPVNGTHSPKQAPSVPTNMSIGVRAEFTLENFVVGSANEEAYRAAKTVSQYPGSAICNPLLVYGGVGLGKTHLLHGIGNEIRANSPTKRVRYLYTVNFVNDVVHTLRYSTLPRYIKELEQCDVLLLDDVHVFSGKQKCSEEFLHLFNRFEARGVQMVFGSSIHPDDIERLNPSLRSRFKSRFAIELQPLNIETRVSMLCHWAKTSNPSWVLSPENARYIAENVNGDARNLSSFWSRLTLLSNSASYHVSRNMIEKTLRAGYVYRKAVSVSRIQSIAAEHYGITLERLLSSSRRSDVVRCRHMAMFFTKQLTKLPLLSIAKRFNRKDHTTVKHACHSMRLQIDQCPETQADYEEIRNKING